MTTLTVIPAIFKDPERASANLVDAKERFDLANRELAASVRKGVTVLPPSRGTESGAFETMILQAQAKHEKLVVEAEHARSDFDVAFAIYQETARARDAAASNKLAESNNATAVASTDAAQRVATLTIVLAVATALQSVAVIVQIWHTWSAQP